MTQAPPRGGKVETKVALCKMCDHDQCHVEVTLRDGRIVDVGSLRGSPFTPWFKIEGCPKMAGAIEQVYHPARLNYPLKRVGGRGENRWQRLTWDQAVDEIAGKLLEIREQYGPEGLACAYSLYNDQWDIGRFCNLWGTPNIDSVDARICGGMEAWINLVTYGGIAHYGPCDPAKTQLIVVWANSPAYTNPIKWARALPVPKKIVIDPVGILEADAADIWLKPRPGTDGALAMGWLNVIINRELYDKEFVSKWCHGFEELKQRVQEWPPDRVAEICGIPEEQLIESAVLYATIKPAYIQWGSPTGYIGYNAHQVERARCALRAITGNLEVAGGNQFVRQYSKQVKMVELEMGQMLSDEQKRKAVGSDRFPGMTWPAYDAVLTQTKKAIRTSVIRGAPFSAQIHAALTGEPYPIKGFIFAGTNALLVTSETRRVYEAIKNVDLYVNLEFFMTPTAALADYLLPVTSWMERPQFAFLEHANNLYTGQRVVPKVVEGQYDRRDDYDFWKMLSERLGLGKYWPWEDLEEVYDYRLRPIETSWEEFSSKRHWDTEPLPHKQYEKDGGFLTPTGKVELWSTILEKVGGDPLPQYEEPPESPVRTPELLEEYPFILINFKSKAFLHAEHRMIIGQRRQDPEPRVQLNPEAAQKLGLKEGDWAWIETRRGRIKQKVRYQPRMAPNTVSAAFGWWFPEKPVEEPHLMGLWESNANVLSSMSLDHCDQMTGNWYLTSMLCKVYPVAGTE